MCKTKVRDRERVKRRHFFFIWFAGCNGSGCRRVSTVRRRPTGTISRGPFFRVLFLIDHCQLIIQSQTKTARRRHRSAVTPFSFVVVVFTEGFLDSNGFDRRVFRSGPFLWRSPNSSILLDVLDFDWVFTVLDWFQEGFGARVLLAFPRCADVMGCQ